MNKTVKIIIAICIMLFCTSCGKEEKQADVIPSSTLPLSQEETQSQTIVEPEPFSEYPEYFRQVLLVRNGLEEPLVEYRTYCYCELISIENNIVVIDWISLGLDKVIHDLVIDLSEESFDINNGGFTLFYSSELETFYMIHQSLDQFDYFEVNMIEFTLDNPEDFTVYKFSNENFGGGEALGFTYLIGDTFYFGLYDITTINVKTKEVYHCLEEHKKATEYATQLLGERRYNKFWLETIVDDVIVYNLIVTEDRKSVV